jgi:hypothetical protein
VSEAADRFEEAEGRPFEAGAEPRMAAERTGVDDARAHAKAPAILRQRENEVHVIAELGSAGRGDVEAGQIDGLDEAGDLRETPPDGSRRPELDAMGNALFRGLSSRPYSGQVLSFWKICLMVPESRFFKAGFL